MQQDQKMPLTSHLVELRKRLIVSIVAVAIGFGISYNYSNELFTILARPLPSNTTFAFTRLVEPFFTYLKVSLLTGIFLSSPVLIYEVWAFIAPGLQENERKWVLPIVSSSIVLFIGGALFGYFLVLPFGYTYFLSFSTDTIHPMLSMDEYFSFTTKFLLAFGIVFELPLFILFLARLGIVDAKMLSVYRKYAVLVIFIAAAILTPTPDAFSQILMAAPMMVLYEVGIITARIFGKKRIEKGVEET
ncbi:MAG: twin arginine-targeting protein translocase TatC [Deltaproteobacteria bacterium RIFCSPLOWO2_12_FULL_43_16]|nr:MAG: twin arginine-targeting protein translocase TatC [Deltaproteobacteria bacterium GWA2_43_19]OGQ10130.1 MAG: twin arginine-targeting protein translocase TatC [Deltaproteobacteria bacterium RIFCSPHIGHO2_02_FULL_43_33]OGQ33879.1 MAG: twin arginine-targeting protein translocase TatC [Deltaproteobacteria bacterium RIFCSPLOWO2_01_FULL_42_9]OGQ58795.1 MAG: twin arginine-targeting protein translocase TatC [Deltaproteobacteria bacterium RIFCSPLOWO2_12_FULL_43_16]HBR17117.1 twin-arginine transloca